MSYQLRGRLCGQICPECPEALSDVRVLIYQAASQEQVLVRAVAQPKDTFAVLTKDEIANKAGSLIAEATTDAEGNFSVDLGERKGYAGGPIEVDVVVATAPRQKQPVKGRGPVQFSITTLQPLWRTTEQINIAAWDYCIPWRFWCAVRGLLGAWTICGQVLVCEEKPPRTVGGVIVRAFDRDWLQDDPLGQATTDAGGHFRIDYTTAAFQRTIFSPYINFEIAGPDVYFQVATPGGTVLLQEPPSAGRAPGRQNAGPCLCVDLCVKEAEPQPGDEPPPAFTAIGNYQLTLTPTPPPAVGLSVDSRMTGVDGSPDPSKFDGPVEVGSVGSLLSKRAVVRGLKVDRAPVPV